MAVALHANRLFRSFPNRRCGSETEIKSYGSCLDTRSWSLCRKNRSKYIADIVRGFHQHDNDFNNFGASGDDGSPFYTARETTSEQTINSNQLKTMSHEDLIAIIMRQNEKEINYKKTINELEELLQTSVNKLKKINSVVTLIHQRIPKTKQQPPSITNRRKSISHLNLSVSRSTSFLDNYAEAATTAEGSTTIKSKIRRQIKSENPRENDEQIIEIERKITKLKVQAAEVDELKMTQFALHEMFADSQKEIKRVQREKKVALNKSAEILAKLMEQLSKQCEQIDVLDNKLRQQIKETETFQKKSMNYENELFKNKKIIAYLCSEIEAMQSELQNNQVQKETVNELKRFSAGLQKRLDDTMASKSSVFSDATTETDDDPMADHQILVSNQLIPDLIVENIEPEKELSSIKNEPIEANESLESIQIEQEAIREEPKEFESSIVDLSIEKIVNIDTLELPPEVPNDVPISLANISREKSKLSFKKFVNNSMERQSFVKTSKTSIKSKQNEKFDPTIEKNLRDQIKSLKSTINNNRNEMNDMRALLKDTKHKLTDQTAKTNHINQILNEINGLMPDNVDSDQTLQQQIHNILAKNSDLTNENQELLHQLDQLNSIVEDIETERSKNDEIENDIKIFERKLSEISSSKLTKSRNNIKSSKSFIKELNSNLNKELEENNRLQSINNELEEKLKLIEKENDNAVQLSQELGDEVNQLTDENSKLQIEIKELKDKVQNLNGKIEQLTEKLKASEIDDTGDENMNQLSDENKKLQREICEFSEKLKTSQMKTEKLQNQLDQLKKTNETAADSDENQLVKLTDKNEKLQNEIIELSEKLETSRMESEKLQKQLDQLKTNNEISVEPVDNQNLLHQLKQAQADAETAKSQLLDAKSMQSGIEEKLQKTLLEIEATKSHVKDLTESEVKQKQEAKELRKKLDEAERQLNANQPIIPTKDTNNDDLIGHRISQIKDLLEKGIQKMEAAHTLELKSVKTKNDNENMRKTSLENIEPIRNNEHLNSESLDWLCKRILNSGIETLNHEELDKLHKDICLAGLKQKSGIFDDIEDKNNKTMTEIEQEMMLKIEHLRAAVNVSQRTLEELRNKKLSKNPSPTNRKAATIMPSNDFISFQIPQKDRSIDITYQTAKAPSKRRPRRNM